MLPTQASERSMPVASAPRPPFPLDADGVVAWGHKTPPTSSLRPERISWTIVQPVPAAQTVAINGVPIQHPWQHAVPACVIPSTMATHPAIVSAQIPPSMLIHLGEAFSTQNSPSSTDRHTVVVTSSPANSSLRVASSGKDSPRTYSHAQAHLPPQREGVTKQIRCRGKVDKGFCERCGSRMRGFGSGYCTNKECRAKSHAVEKLGFATSAIAVVPTEPSA